MCDRHVRRTCATDMCEKPACDPGAEKRIGRNTSRLLFCALFWVILLKIFSKVTQNRVQKYAPKRPHQQNGALRASFLPAFFGAYFFKQVAQPDNWKCNFSDKNKRLRHHFRSKKWLKHSFSIFFSKYFRKIRKQGVKIKENWGVQ